MDQLHSRAIALIEKIYMGAFFIRQWEAASAGKTPPMMSTKELMNVLFDFWYSLPNKHEIVSPIFVELTSILDEYANRYK